MFEEEEDESSYEEETEVWFMYLIECNALKGSLINLLYYILNTPTVVRD